MFKLIEQGEVYAPEPLGVHTVLLIGERIARLGPVDIQSLQRLGLPVEVINARGCLVTPGLVDPHSHLIGTGGEQGYLSRTMEVPLEELVGAGVTTVVGCLGTDDTARSLASLLAQTRKLQRQGISAYMYTGSFYYPPPTLTGNIRSDFLLIPEVIGVGELAISDVRSIEPTAHDLARLASDALVGGLLGEKAGVVHFHVGPGDKRLSLLHKVITDYEVPARHLYPTHITRSRELMDDAIALSKRGSYVDMDTIDPGLGRWAKYFLEHGGVAKQLTASSDAHAPKGSELKLRSQVVQAVKEEGIPLEQVLSIVTRNPAEALKLPQKGRVQPGADADLLVMERGSLALKHVLGRGRWLMRDGQIIEQKPPET